MKRVLGVLIGLVFLILSSGSAYAENCSFSFPGQVTTAQIITITVTPTTLDSIYNLEVFKDGSPYANIDQTANSTSLIFSVGPYPEGFYGWSVWVKNSNGQTLKGCFAPPLPKTTQVVNSSGKFKGSGCGTAQAKCVADPNGVSLTECQKKCKNTLTSSPPPNDPCAGAGAITSSEYQKCNDCLKGNDPATAGKPGAYTALGCISTDPQGFVSWLLGAVIGIAGGIVFLLILYGGFQILTSTGDPEKLNNGKEIIVSAIAGLLMIVFSVLLLKIIGVDILKIPGFQK
ncbi:MAG: pilin [Patescibacteria group bacterium]|nr:pilin [Patescibacteria group bacterium]MCL5095796.1 pilin [Patescibacteria group bacterium]